MVAKQKNAIWRGAITSDVWLDKNKIDSILNNIDNIEKLEIKL